MPRLDNLNEPRRHAMPIPRDDKPGERRPPNILDRRRHRRRSLPRADDNDPPRRPSGQGRSQRRAKDDKPRRLHRTSGEEFQARSA